MKRSLTDDPRSFRALLLAAALAGWASPLSAETMFSFFLGASRTSSSDVHVSQPGSGSDATFHDVKWTTDSFSPPLYYGLRLTHFFGAASNWGAGLEFTHDKVYSNPDQITRVRGRWNNAPVDEVAPMSRRVQLFNISHGVNVVALNVFHRFKIIPGWLPGFGLQPYVGGGPTYYLLHAENVVNGQANVETTKGGGSGFQVLGGVQFGITPIVHAFLEAKYNNGTVNVDIAGGRASTTLKTAQMLAGVSIGW